MRERRRRSGRVIVREGHGVASGPGLVELKRTLDGRVVEYPAEPLLVEPDVRAVILCTIAAREEVAGGRMVLAPGTLSVGHFWQERPYNVYHWLVEGETLAHYVNIGRVQSLSERAVVWDDHAVDVLRYPDGTVEVVDEDEIPTTIEASLRAAIDDATRAALRDLPELVVAVERETRALLAAHTGSAR